MSLTTRLTRYPWLLLVTGLLAGALGVAMHQSGAHHQALYNSFQDCVQHETNAPVCLLDGRDSGASTASEFQANFETQLRLARVLLGVGAVEVLGAAAGFSLRRRRSAPPVMTELPA